MAAKKNKKPARLVLPAWLGRVGRLARGPGRPVVIALAMVLLLYGTGYGCWRWVRGRVLSSEPYMVTAGRLDITRPPSWIRSDIRAEVYRDVTFDGPLPIMAPDAVKRVADAFALHPWVACVHRVTKQYPARIKVELNYRRPVCMVERPGGDQGRELYLYPVDVYGVRLPFADFTSVEASTRYPRLGGVDSDPLGPPGTRWGDERVVGGAEIAAVLSSVWRELQLHRIVPDRQAPSGQTAEFTYVLLTRGGTPIHWGRAPHTRWSAETPVKEKIARLRQLAAKHGSLDGLGPIDLSRRETALSLQSR